MIRDSAKMCAWVLVAAACGDGGNNPMPPVDAPPEMVDAPDTVTFTRHVVDTQANGPAYVSVADIDGDSKLDLVVAHLGVLVGLALPEGRVSIYKRGTSLDSWTRSDLVPTTAGVKFPGQPQMVDIDGDQDLDMLLPSGFLVCGAIPMTQPCGGLGWYEQTSTGWTRHDVVAIGSESFYHHAELVDFDGDGIKDLVTSGEQGGAGASAVTEWFKGTNTAARFETTARKIGDGGGSFPRAVDVDGDGDLDVASAQFFVNPAFVWFERTGAPSAGSPAGTWTRHTINADMGKSIMLTAVDNLYGDNVRRYIGANHTNPASRGTDPPPEVAVLTPGADMKQPWAKSKISGTITSRPNMGMAQLGAPGIFGVGDADGDNRLDVIVSGDGDENVYLLRQTVAGQFEQSVLETGLGQAGGTTIHDLDGDGRNEIIMTGYEDSVIYIYTR